MGSLETRQKFFMKFAIGSILILLLFAGLIPIPGHTVAPQQHAGLYPVHGGPLIQPGIIQQHVGDMGQMMGPPPGGRGEFHHHGYVGHPPPPPGAPVYRPRPPGPGGNYY